MGLALSLMAPVITVCIASILSLSQLFNVFRAKEHAERHHGQKKEVYALVASCGSVRQNV